MEGAKFAFNGYSRDCLLWAGTAKLVYFLFVFLVMIRFNPVTLRRVDSCSHLGSHEPKFRLEPPERVWRK